MLCTYTVYVKQCKNNTLLIYAYHPPPQYEELFMEFIIHLERFSDPINIFTPNYTGKACVEKGGKYLTK